MNLIQTFYKNLDPLEVIIFWGIIIVIILLIILLIILTTKKKKERKIILNEYPEEIPILIEDNIKEQSTINDTYNPEETILSISENNNLLEEIEPIIEDKEENEIKEQSEVQTEQNKYKTTFEMPTGPYQRNVLREMSLSQTSPIGINRKDEYIKPQDLFEMYNKQESKVESTSNYEPDVEIPQESEVKIENTHKQTLSDSLVEENLEEDTTYNNELLEEINIIEEQPENNMGIERTQYEIEQEENAIISYKELMEKKDSIQTIDEEEAIISIEELLNKNNSKEQNKEESKLYNISENEENDSFINELKQFRKDL